MGTDAQHATEAGSVVVRRAAVADARTIAEIGIAGWQAAYRGILPADFLARLSVTAREAAWQSMLGSDEEEGAPAWIAERDRRGIGFVASGPPRDEDVLLPGAEIYAIYVYPDAWRSGAGRALLTTAADHWRGRGVTTLVLWVLEANVAGRAFYEAMGWSADGRRQEIDFGAFSAPEVRYRLRV